MRLLVGDGLSFYEGMPGKEYSSLDIYDKNGLRAGRVEMCWNGNFTAVCSEQWDNRDASVVCRQLGFSPYGTCKFHNYSWVWLQINYAVLYTLLLACMHKTLAG